MTDYSETAFAFVAVENCAYSFDRLFSFSIPSELAPSVIPGVRVLVPFGASNVKRQGFVFSISDSCDVTDSSKIKPICEVIDAKPLLSDELILLAKWLRETTFCTYFVAAKALLPGGMCMRTEKTYAFISEEKHEDITPLGDDAEKICAFLKKTGTYIRKSVILKKCGLNKDSQILSLLERKGLVRSDIDTFANVHDLTSGMVRLCDDFVPENDMVSLTPKQRRVASALIDIGAATPKELCYYTGVTAAVIKLMIEKGYCESFEVSVMRTPEIAFSSPDEKHVLSESQTKALNELYSAYKTSEFNTCLLFGVTGSGKTSVYTELIDRVLEDNKTVIVLVPEISLTPQTVSLFSARYKNKVAMLHSGMSAGERFDEWKRINTGEASVVVGTRSAVFAPLKNLGLIIIDEEQEHTYKSEMAPRYNAKDVARFRCAYNKALLVPASATPSVEAFARAQQGKYKLCELPVRYGSAKLPLVKTVDMTDKSLLSSFYAISNPLAEEIQKNLDSGEQTILLVNRRGYNTFVVCKECKHVITCPNCSISMTYHSANNRLMCHYCGHSVEYTSTCPICSSENIRYSGFGTQRVEQELKIRFPNVCVLRMDADTTTAKNSHDKALSAFSQGKYDILLGTQMVAKGLDFPNVTLVGVLSADKELYNDDFRSSEKTFDMLTQVVGRAGRGSVLGRAVIQTVSPDNDIIDIAAKQNYRSFYEREIVIRKAMVYPPFCDIIMIAFSGTDDTAVENCAKRFFEMLTAAANDKNNKSRMIVLGPLAPRVERLNRLFRQRIIIKCKNSPAFRELINGVLQEIYADKAYKKISIYVDVNPEKTD